MSRHKNLHRGKNKANSRKTAATAKHKANKRQEAEARNAKYQALSLEEKLARNSTRVRTKLQGVGK
jgi:hypothetical protein